MERRDGAPVIEDWPGLVVFLAPFCTSHLGIHREREIQIVR